ncbi:MAG: N-acetylmuramoyl-L-alanine amidase [Anaerolineaceae bacterium]
MTKTMHQTDEEPGKAGSVQKETPSPKLAREPKQKPGKSKPAKTPKTSWQVLQNVLGAGVIVATLFTIWTPTSLLASSLQNRIMKALSAQNQDVDALVEEGMPADFPLDKIGIVVGHKGNDSGAVCSNGLTEVEVNNNVATFVQQKLSKMGYEVELLEEFDTRLDGYQAGLLLSIHSDSCDYINDGATGFKVAAALSETKADNSARLVSCMADRYQKATGLQYHYQSITTDMTYYHAFNEIDPFTTAGIIEIGFMNLDMKILTEEPELIADGIVEGIRCYMNNESVEPTSTVPPTP